MERNRCGWGAFLGRNLWKRPGRLLLALHQDYRKTWFNFRSLWLLLGQQEARHPGRNKHEATRHQPGFISWRRLNKPCTERKLKLYILIMARWLQTGPTRQSAFNDSTLISVNSIIRVMKPQRSWWIWTDCGWEAGIVWIIVLFLSEATVDGRLILGSDITSAVYQERQVHFVPNCHD